MEIEKRCDLKKRTVFVSEKEIPFLDWYQKNTRIFQEKSSCLYRKENIDPLLILNTFRMKSSLSLEESSQRISQYKHKNFSNRLIHGDSKQVMQSLIDWDHLEDSVKMFYFDPPYGVGYNANFQLRNSILQEKGKLTRRMATIRAFEDTWKNGIHSYLQYIYDNLLIARRLLCEQGSIFVQIGDENLANVSKILDEVFGSKNKISLISIKKTSGFGAAGINNVCDYILWYARDKNKCRIKKLFCKQNLSTQDILKTYKMIREKDGSLQKISCKKDFILKKDQILARCECVHSEGETSTGSFPIEFEGKTYYPPKGRHWTTHELGMKKLIQLGRIAVTGNQLAYVRHWGDFPCKVLTNLWSDVSSGFGGKEYAVQTSMKCIQRCMLMSTDPGDLVMDITCGGGTTPLVAEQWGRRWVAVDNSSVSIHVTKRRLIYRLYPHYKLAKEEQGGVDGDFLYQSFPHVTIKSLANEIEFVKENLYDAPLLDKKKTRVSSAFTVENFYQGGKFLLFSEEEISRCGKEIVERGIVGISGEIIKIFDLQEYCRTDVTYLLGKTSSNKTLCFVFNFVMGRSNMQNVLSEIQSDFFIFCGLEDDFFAAAEVNKCPNAYLMTVRRGLSEQYLSRNKSPTSWMLGNVIVSTMKDVVSMDHVVYRVKIGGFQGLDGNLHKETFGINRVVMWMIDSHYDGKIFSPSQSFIPIECEESWTKFAKKNCSGMKQEIQQGVHRGGESLPFRDNVDMKTSVAIMVIDDFSRTMRSIVSSSIDSAK